MVGAVRVHAFYPYIYVAAKRDHYVSATSPCQCDSFKRDLEAALSSASKKSASTSPEKAATPSKKQHAAEEKSSARWACASCTYINDAQRQQCEMCSAARPPSEKRSSTAA